MPKIPLKRVFDLRGLWLLVSAFVVGEWLILFHPALRESFVFFRQSPYAIACDALSAADAAQRFFTMRAWVIVSLVQAIVWGCVASVSLRWLVALWRSGNPDGRWLRVLKIAIRCLLFGLGLWFLLTPAPQWNLACFAGHVSERSSGVLAYIAVAFAVIVMWVLEDRVCRLNLEVAQVAVIRTFLDLRTQLQALLSMSSLVLGFGVIGLMARRAFVQPLSPNNFFPGSIVLEGFEYTLLLGLAYAPVHAAFNAIGGRLRDLLTPEPSNATPEALEKWAKRTDELNELFQVSVYDWKNFGPIYPILAPFVLGLLESLIKTG